MLAVRQVARGACSDVPNPERDSRHLPTAFTRLSLLLSALYSVCVSQVTFAWRPPTSGPIANSSVMLRGSFDDWRPTPLVQQESGDWTVTRMVRVHVCVHSMLTPAHLVSALSPLHRAATLILSISTTPLQLSLLVAPCRSRPTSSCTCSRWMAPSGWRRTKCLPRPCADRRQLPRCCALCQILSEHAPRTLQYPMPSGFCRHSLLVSLTTNTEKGHGWQWVMFPNTLIPLH